MKRRTYLTTMLAGAAPLAVKAAGPTGIQLHVDLSVDPGKEASMMKHYREVFLPAIRKQEGYIDVKMVKLRSTPMGKAPDGVNWRFVLNFKNEELRQKWINSALHQQVWTPMESMLRTKNYTVMLFDVQE
jgi:antibiotic biosynthesis monooxygenase (ABM) superfamily enzyme